MVVCRPKSRLPPSKSSSTRAHAYHALPELLGESDDDALRAADETEPVHVLVLGDFAHEFSAMGAQAREDVVDVVDGEHDATYAQRVRRCVFRLTSDRRRRVELRQLDPPVAVRGPHHSDVDLDALEPAEAVHPGAFDRHLAFTRHAEGGEEGNGGWEVVDDDADMVHSLDCHVPSLVGAMRDCPG